MAQCKYNISDTKARLLGLYFYIENIEDLIIKTECLSLVLSRFTQIDPDEIIEHSEGIFEICRNEIKHNCESISEFVADHLKAFKSIIKNLSSKYHELVIQIIDLINTQYRKDRCYYVALESYILSSKGDSIEISVIHKYINPIIDEQVKAYLIYKSCELLTHKKSQIDQKVIGYFSSHLDEIHDASAKVSALAYLMEIDISKKLSEKYWQTLVRTWEEIDLFTDKIETGYSVVSSLSVEYQSNAVELFRLVNDFEARSLFRNSKMFVNYVLYLRNLIRAFSGLVNKKTYTEDDTATLEMLIQTIPSANVKIKTWNDLSARLYSYDNKTYGDKIVEDKIIPLLDQFVESERFIKEDALIEAIVSIYICKPILAINRIKSIQGIQRDFAIRNICNYILYHAVPSDPLDSMNRYSLILKHDEYISMIELLELSQNDSICYEIIEDLINSIDRNKKYLNEQQRDNILRQIRTISLSKFPVAGCIQHDGYKIIALAQIFSVDNSLVKFQELIDDAHIRVKNKADLVYVLAILARQSKKSLERKNILEQAEKIIDEIPSMYEQIEHLQFLGYHNWACEKTKGKHFFQKALELCKKSDDEANEKSQRRIIEMANRLDSELAKSLLAIIDNDEGRMEARKNAQSHNVQLKLRELMQVGETPDREQIIEGSNNLLRPGNSSLKLPDLPVPEMPGIMASTTTR